MPGFCALDGYGPGQDVSGQCFFGMRMDIGNFGRCIKSGLFGRVHVRPARHGLDSDLIAALDSQTRFQCRIKKPPMTCFAAGFEEMMHRVYTRLAGYAFGYLL